MQSCIMCESNVYRVQILDVLFATACNNLDVVVIGHLRAALMMHTTTFLVTN